MSIRRADLSGQTFNDWTVIRYSHTGKDGSAYWVCRCVCGTERPVRSLHLKAGRTSCCGCKTNRKFQNKTDTNKRRIEYNAWVNMKSRCYNKSRQEYKNYGGRGITVCARWMEGFDNFYSDMGKRPSPRYSLERIDNNKPYSPDNCEWALRRDQNRNHRRNKVLKYKGRSMCLMDWATHLGITQQALQWRLKNWPLERALGESAHDNMRR